SPICTYSKLKPFFLVSDEIIPTLIKYTFSFSKRDRNFNAPKLFCHFLDVDSIFWDRGVLAMTKCWESSLQQEDCALSFAQME
ncbi:hypothetical protein M1146_03440, partial [Patescibacteria group bacterium]|nr:hypothetical protein [Patescibacteria group bacterium]